jgi:hypothetical protein
LITLTIPEATPSLNRCLGIHWAKRTTQRKRWLWFVRAARLEAKCFPQSPLPKAKVTITRYGRRICDTDNLIGGTKMLTDSLVKEGILANDTPAHIELVVTQKVTKTPHTVVTIEAA